MVPEIISVIDRIVALLKGRAVARRQLFEDFVDPLFADMERIHSDYHEAFLLLEKQVNDNFIPPHRELVAALRLRRQELLHLRDKTRLLVGTIRDTHNRKPWLPEQAERFFETVCEYYAVPFDRFPFPDGRTHFGSFIDMMQAVEHDQTRRQKVAVRADQFATVLSDVWQLVAGQYARAKVACLK